MLTDSPIFFHFTYTARTFRKLWNFGFFGANTSQDIPLIGLEEARVVTECNGANGIGCNAASRFGFGMWDRKAKGERNETAGWPECNGMKEAFLRG